MERKLFGLFSGTHLTIIATAFIGMLSSGAVWAVDAFSNVAIEDPVSGKKASVDTSRRLVVTDTTLEMDEVPAYFFRVFASAQGGGCSTVYTVPAGKALIIQSMASYLDKTDASLTSVEEDLYGQANCNGGLIAAAITSDRSATVNQTFGSGIAIPSGRVISVYGTNNNGSLSIYGYFVPAAWVPANANATSQVRFAPGQSPIVVGGKR